MRTTAAQARVLTALEAAAEAGAPCPMNKDLADVAGLDRTATACAVVGQLEQLGLIRVQRFSVSRIVTITATGKSTQAVEGNPHWRQDPNRVARAMVRSAQTKSITAALTTPRSEPVMLDVPRDPCFRCGVRGDIGCVHQGFPA